MSSCSKSMEWNGSNFNHRFSYITKKKIFDTIKNIKIYHIDQIDKD